MTAIEGKTRRDTRRSDGSQVHLLPTLDTITGIVLTLPALPRVWA
ncbi:hypothetical protein AB0B27_14970 [Micromonospora rifamycinica]